MKRALLTVGLLTLACATPPPPKPVEPLPLPKPAVVEAPPLLQLPRHTVPKRVSLWLELLPSAANFKGRETIDVELIEPRQVIWLNGRNLTVTKAEANGIAGRWEQVDAAGVAKVTFPAPLPAGKVVLSFEWTAAWDTQLSGIYLSNSDKERYVGSQFEAIYARRAFPCFDEPDFKTPWDLTLVVDAAHVAIANTAVVSEKALEGGRKEIRFGTTLPLPSYLLNVSVGPFDVVAPGALPPNDVRGRPLQVRGIAPKGRGKELGYALSAGAELLVDLEHYFGLPFPYEKLDHIALPDNFGGAMENAGAITYSDTALLFQPGVSSEEEKLEIAASMAHEMAHQWFGDSVTLAWWDDTWLNESFASWLEHRIVDNWDPKLGVAVVALEGAHAAMDDDSLIASRKIRQPLERIEQVDDQFDSLTYQKGGAVLGMFEAWLGAEVFRSGVHDYLSKRANGLGDTHALLSSLERAAHRPVEPAFQSFLEQPGVPLVTVTPVCEGKPSHFELSQRRWLAVGSQAPADLKWQVPVCVSWGEGKKTAHACTLLEGQTGTLAIPSGICPDWVFPNAGANGYYRYGLTAAGLEKLRTHAKLSVLERLSLASNLEAAIDANTLAFDQAWPTLEWLARDPDGDVASQVLGVFGWLHNDGTPAGLEPKVTAALVKLLRPSLDRLGWTPKPKEPASARRLRARLISFLALDLHDADTVKKAAALGRGVVRGDAVSPDLAGIVLGVAVRNDPALFDTVLDKLKDLDDGEQRARVLFALGATDDGKQLEQLLKLWADPRLKQSETMMGFVGPLSRPATRELAWTAFQRDFDQVTQKIDPTMATMVPRFVDRFCDEAHAQQVSAFFQPKLAALPGEKRSLDLTLEEIRRCAAITDAQRAGITAVFQKR